MVARPKASEVTLELPPGASDRALKADDPRISGHRIVCRESESGRMVGRSTTDQGRRVLIEQPVRLGVLSGRDVLAVTTTSPGEICVLPLG
jgi:hypothetical protein